jgi:hypothetical protein
MKYLAQARGRRSAAVAAMTVLASGAMTASLALTSAPAQASANAPAKVHYSFKTLNNQDDPTFNQLLGINDSGKIAGYFGSGLKGHPNKGYTLTPPYRQLDYRNQNFPGSRQTQVTGLNNTGIQVGFWSTMNTASGNNNNFGYYSINGTNFHKVDFPTSHPSSPPVDQLLGVNDSGVAVGFYMDSSDNTHGYIYDIPSKIYLPLSSFVTIKGATSTMATGINDEDSICGVFVNAKGVMEGFLARKATPHLFIVSVPHSSSTFVAGVNKFGVVVGVYSVGTGSSAKMYGFTWSHGRGYQTISDPLGVGTTTLNGINDKGDLVGFYVGKHGNTNGFIATP